ncbi:hypothetical protein Acr_12g0009420 [Actinidia rufa]|uniref:Uncharacterized protein n=1 Tax=Actinidia rufa TaxID=165716 RepID=A0A7J0FIA1_9ERIC|nr:hypothetical protein Acr_12g0009420 [Actinidia rufa]
MGNQRPAEGDESTVIMAGCEEPTVKTKHVRTAFENTKRQYKEPRAVNRHRNQPRTSTSSSHDLSKHRFSLCELRDNCKGIKHTMTKYGLTRAGVSALLSLGSKLGGPQELGEVFLNIDTVRAKAIVAMGLLLLRKLGLNNCAGARTGTKSSSHPERHGWVSHLPTDTAVGAFKVRAELGYKRRTVILTQQNRSPLKALETSNAPQDLLWKAYPQPWHSGMAALGSASKNMKTASLHSGSKLHISDLT